MLVLTVSIPVSPAVAIRVYGITYISGSNESATGTKVGKGTPLDVVMPAGRLVYKAKIEAELQVYVSASVVLTLGCAQTFGQHWKLENAGGWVLEESLAL